MNMEFKGDRKHVFERLAELYRDSDYLGTQYVLENGFSAYGSSFDEYDPEVNYYNLAMDSYLNMIVAASSYEEDKDEMNAQLVYHEAAKIAEIAYEYRGWEDCRETGTAEMIWDFTLRHRAVVLPSESGIEGQKDIWITEPGTGVMIRAAILRTEDGKVDLEEAYRKGYDEGADFLNWVYEALDKRQKKDNKKSGEDNSWEAGFWAPRK